MAQAANALDHPKNNSERLAFESDADRLASFGRALDALRREVEEDLSTRDVEHVRAVRGISTALEIMGRSLVHFSLEPVSFVAGVATLSAHKALELMELGHTVLHGAYDRLPGAEKFRSEEFWWKAPIDERSWRAAHNVRHHQYTNVAGRDPDLDFGVLRLSESVPHRWHHALQPVSNVASWLWFASAINLHVTGVIEVYTSKKKKGHALPDRTWRSILDAHRRFSKKATRYYARELVLFPALAGPFFWKILLGNVLSEVIRDVYAGAVIYCGHVGADEHPHEARARGRAEFYAMQVESSCNFEVPLILSVLAGGLDRQIEHHLFPRLPPNRLRQIAPRVRQICEAHGVNYRTDAWPRRLKEVMVSLSRLRRPGRAAGSISSGTEAAMAPA